MELSIVINALGLRGALSHRTYERMVETWIDANEPIPSLEECVAKWNELVAFGYFEPPYHVKRLEAYQQQGLDMQKIVELTTEYTAAVAAGDDVAAAKYSALLADVHAKRTAIKQQFPKA